MCYADLIDHTPEQISAIAKLFCMRLQRDLELPRKPSTPPAAPGSSRLVSPNLAVGGITIEATS